MGADILVAVIAFMTLFIAFAVVFDAENDDY